MRASGPVHQEILCKSALNRVRQMGFRWSLNPYQGCFHACVYCFARFHAQLADRDPAEGFSSGVRIKINVVEVLKKELSSRFWKRETIAFGTATDPYQPLEGKYRLTRGCLTMLSRYRTPVSLITKGTLIVRDLDVLTELAQRAETSVSFSIPTVDEDVWRKTEPGTPPPYQRLRALKKLVDAGIKAGVGLAPLLPGISDSPEQLKAAVRAAAEAGACFLWGGIVYLKPGTKEYFMNFLQREFPHLALKYQTLFPGAYAPSGVQRSITNQVSQLKLENRIHDQRKRKLQPPPQPVQLSLFSEG